MTRKLSEDEIAEIEADPDGQTKPKLVQYLEEKSLDTSGNKDDLVARIQSRGEEPADADAGRPHGVFRARFDPANPPKKDPGPIVSEGPQESKRASADTVGTSGAEGPLGTGGAAGTTVAGAGTAAGGTTGTTGNTGNVGSGGTPSGGTTSTPGTAT